EAKLYFSPQGPLAQLVEQRTFNPKVRGSTPRRPTNRINNLGNQGLRSAAIWSIFGPLAGQIARRGRAEHMDIQRRVGKNGKASWRVRVRMKGHPIQTETFDRKTDAAQWGESVRAAIREGRRFPTSEARRHTLAELVDRYRQERFPDYDEGEQRERAAKLTWWMARLGDRYLSDLAPAAISEAR